MRSRGARAAERGEVPLRTAAQGRASRSPRLLELRQGHRVRRRRDREAPGSRLQGIRLRRHVALPPDPGPLLRVPKVGRETPREVPAPPEVAPALVLFRRNLRLDDNRPLDAALRAAGTVVPVFVLDDHYLTDDFSPPRLAFLAESLRELAGSSPSKARVSSCGRGPCAPRSRPSRKRRTRNGVYARGPRAAREGTSSRRRERA